eukprot:11052155-Alexandrium_andersonii.AAC.1
MLLVQWAGGLRPGEIVQVTRGHIIPSRLNTVNPDEGLLLLGPRRGTKVGRPQCVRILRSECPEALM